MPSSRIEDAQRGPRPLVRDEGALDQRDAADRAVGHARVVEVVVLAVDAVDELPVAVLLLGGRRRRLLEQLAGLLEALARLLEVLPRLVVRRGGWSISVARLVVLLTRLVVGGGGLLVLLGHRAVAGVHRCGLVVGGEPARLLGRGRRVRDRRQERRLLQHGRLRLRP